MGFLTNMILGPPKKQQPESETRRIMVVNEPEPSTKQQVGSWINEGSLPQKLIRMDEKIGSMFGRVHPHRLQADKNQFINKKNKVYGDPNNINQMFDGNDFISTKRRRR